MKFSRKEFLKISGASATALASTVLSCTRGPSTDTAAPPSTGGASELSIPKPKQGSARVAVIGGGWSGLTVAKYIKQGNADVDVVLIEQRDNFFSCPVSNLWLVGSVPLEFLVYDYQNAADKYGYHYVKATVQSIDREKRRIYTDGGYVGYDFLALSPGIDYDYSIWVGNDPEEVEMAGTRYPAAFKPGSEHMALKRKIHNFEKGVFLITVPPGLDYRCLPAPYERATLIAEYFKKHKLPAKVVLVDPHTDPPVKAKGFHYAWEHAVKGYLEYNPNAGIKRVDVRNKKVETETYGDISFDDANIYPHCKAARLVFDAGLVKAGERWADIDPFYYRSKADERVFVAGDARNQPFSKSGNTANSEAQFVAKVILDSIKGGKQTEYAAPKTLCYSAVGDSQAVWIDLTYKWDDGKKAFEFANVKMDEVPKNENYKAYLEWARGLYRDMIGYSNEPA